MSKQSISTSTAVPGGIPLDPRSNQLALIVAVAGTVLFLLPTLGAATGGLGQWPGYMVTGDIRMLWFPQFVRGYEMFWDGGIFGVDFLAGGGASALALRSNLLPVYPPFILSYLLFDCSNLKVAKIIFHFWFAAHVFAALYFGTLLGKHYLRLGTGGSILFTSVYALSFQMGMYVAFPPFFFQMMLVPVLAYVACRLVDTRSLAAVIGVAVVVNYMLTSYAPTMAAGLGAAGLLTIMSYLPFLGETSEQDIRSRLAALKCLWRPAVAVAVAAAVTLPYYFAQATLFRSVAGLPKKLSLIAHTDSIGGRAAFDAISASVLGVASYEGRIYWGVSTLVIVVIGLVVLAVNRDSIRPRLRGMLLCSVSIYLFTFFISMGPATVASDAFFYAVPVLGWMHLYQRFLMFTQVFAALAVAISAVIVVTSASARQRAVILTAGIATWLILTVVIAVYPGTQEVVATGTFIPELLGAVIVVAILTLGHSSVAIAALALPILASSLMPWYNLQRSFGGSDMWADHLSYRRAAQDEVLAPLVASSKALPKVINITDEIDSYFPHNLPWLQSKTRKFMTYYGYELHLALDREYLAMMGGYYGRFNRDWVLRTGTDFVVWDDKTAWKLPLLLSDTASLGEKVSLGGGKQFIAPIVYKQAPRLGQSTLLLSYPQSDSGRWRSTTSDGWELRSGTLVKTGSDAARFAVPLGLVRGATYDVSLDVVDSTRGSVNVSLGGGVGAPIDGAQPGRQSRSITTVFPADLWITATPDFDGAVTNIEIREKVDPSLAMLDAVADNGVLRLEAEAGKAEMKSFATNWSTRVTATVSGTGPSRLVYLLWPSRFLTPFVDGKPVEWVRNGNWPAYVDIPAGEHTFELRFTNLWTGVFKATSLLFCLAFVGVMLWTFFKSPRARSWRSWARRRSAA